MSFTWPEMLAALQREGLVVSRPDTGADISGVQTDSRTVAVGDVFVAVPGSDTDGHRFLDDAVRRGATAVVVERPGVSPTVPEVVVHDARRAALVLAEEWYGKPADRLDLIGITGTNGKTTTTQLARHLLNERETVGTIGTLGAFDGLGEPVPSSAGLLTTPGAVDLQATLASLVARGTLTVALEASSHSLEQGRLDGLTFAAVIFTNLSRDHLDYHGTMEAYRAAKLRLADYLAPDGVAIVNRDDDSWGDVSAPRVVTFGIEVEADVRAGHLSMDSSGSRFELTGNFGTRVIALPLLGAFNVHNALGAAACALSLGLDLGSVARRLESAPQVPGRLDLISGRPCPVLRDYAHTPDALERVLRSLKPLVRGRLIVVFGCGGDRDRGKRPIMGRIASEWADLPVLTSDNPRTEDPEAILDDVEQGMADGHIRITDRREAIEAALNAARSEDTVLLAGKGHETYQIIGQERHPFDEVSIVQDLVGS